MATSLRVTEQFVYLAASTQLDQPLYTAVEVLAYDALDLLATAAFSGPTTPSLTIDLLSGMQTVSTDAWIKIASFPTLSSSVPVVLSLPQGGFFRYVRWSVGGNGLQGATAVRFMIEAVGRKNA